MSQQPQQPEQIDPAHVISTQKEMLEEQGGEVVRLRASLKHLEARYQSALDGIVGKINGVQSLITAEFKESEPEIFERFSKHFDTVFGDAPAQDPPQG